MGLRTAYALTFRKMMTKVKRASDSMKARPRIRKTKIPGRAPGLRASASVAEAVALPWPSPQRPAASAMPRPAASGTHVCRSAGRFALCEGRRRQQHRGESHEEILQFTHSVNSVLPKYAASGWLMLTVLAPSR